MEGNGYFEAVFSMSDWRQSARFKYNGQLTETESEGSSSNFPAPVNFTLERAYKGHKVKYAATVVSADNTRTYKAVLLSGAKKQEVLLNADGTLVKQ